MPPFATLDQQAADIQQLIAEVDALDIPDIAKEQMKKQFLEAQQKIQREQAAIGPGGPRGFTNTGDPLSNVFAQGSPEDAILSLLGIGPTQEQQNLLGQLADKRFEAGAKSLEKRFGRAIDTIGTNAVGRNLLSNSNLARSRAGLAAQGLADGLTQLRSDVDTSVLGELFSIPRQNVALASGLNAQGINRNLTQQQLAFQREQFEEGNKGPSFLDFSKNVIGTATGGFLGGVAENAANSIFKRDR
jgi:hypothetical protein